MTDAKRGAEPLGPRFARGAVHLVTGQWLAFALNFVLHLAIARILGPDAFGPYASAFALCELLVILGAFSLNLALVQFREESQSLYDTALALCAGLGVVGMLASLGLAAFAAQRHSVEVAWFVVVLGGARLLNLLVLVPWAKMERSFRYRALATVGVLGGGIGNVCALGLAWAGLGAWSLVFRDLLSAALNLGLIALLSGYRFRFQVEHEAARRLVRFSRRLFAAQALDTLLDRTDRVALASAFSSQVVGLYHQARYLALSGPQAARPLLQLSFNLYARTQDVPERLARAHRVVNYCLARGAAAVATVWLVFPEETVRLLLGDAWVPASPMLRWLGIYSVLLPVAMSSKQLLLARGQAMKAVQVRSAQALVFLPGVAAAAWLGSVSGVVVALTAATLVGIALANRDNAKVVDTRLRSALAVPLLACAATWLGFELLARGGVTPRLPWPIRPLLPPLAFGLVLLLAERRTLVAEIGAFLRALRETAVEATEVETPGAR